LSVHLAAAADEGTRSAIIRGAQPELRAALDDVFGTSGGDRG
jgi:hypothetical protein